MSFTSRAIGQLLKLPPAETHRFTVRRDVPITMADGAVLLADHYVPAPRRSYPTLLIRTPYGRRGILASVFVLPFVERGYQVFIQSCRGTAGSGGDFVFARNEHADGLATIAWIKQQPWYSGQLAMAGASYLGFVQWAVAAAANDDLRAMVTSITSADFNHFRYQGGSLTLESLLGWSTMMTRFAATGQRLRDMLGSARRERMLEKAYLSVPLGKADSLVVRRSSQSFQDVITYPPDDDYWQPVDFSEDVGKVTVPVAHQAGWYDLFLDWQLKDYRAQRAAGHRPYLLIGPWYHGQPASLTHVTRDTLAWLNAQVKGDRRGLRARPVRLFVMGSNVWRDFDDWPPPAQQLRWYLQPNAALSTTAAPADSEPDRYRYDPADPTPAVGGNVLGAQARMGPKDNRALEARSDVLVYTSAELTGDIEVIGPVTADLYVRSSLQHTDVFVRLCVVEPSGKSINLCDGILRLTPEDQLPESDGVRHIQVALWPTAYHFKRGQRVRVQVSSGAHPRFARNPGSGEPLATATALIAADQTVYHDSAHPSALLIPVV